jgi:hypothetical protein
MDPVHWFLDGKEDVRSSYYLEDVATEFHVQGLELDWACITWMRTFVTLTMAGNIGPLRAIDGIASIRFTVEII